MILDRKTFPQFPDDVYGRMRREDLTRVTKEIYKLEPMIFYKLKPIQEKSLLGFLNLLLSSEEREQVLTIIEQVVELTPEQRSEFSKMLRRTSLENIVDTIKFLEERFRVIEILRSLVFDMTEFSNERDHIQKLVEQHFWLFGEQYNLASADQRMKKALEGLDGYHTRKYGDAETKQRLKEALKQASKVIKDRLFTEDCKPIFEEAIQSVIPDWKYNSSNVGSISDWIAEGYLSRKALSHRLKELDKSFLKRIEKSDTSSVFCYRGHKSAI